MKKVTVTDTKGRKMISYVQNEKVTGWVEARERDRMWGNPELWVKREDVERLGLDWKKCKAKRSYLLGEVEVTEFFFPAEYKIEIVDVDKDPKAESWRQAQRRQFMMPSYQEFFEAYYQQVVKKDSNLMNNFLNRVGDAIDKYPFVEGEHEGAVSGETPKESENPTVEPKPEKPKEEKPEKPKEEKPEKPKDKEGK